MISKLKKLIAGGAAFLPLFYFAASWLNTISVNLSGGSVAAWNIFNLI